MLSRGSGGAGDTARQRGIADDGAWRRVGACRLRCGLTGMGILNVDLLPVGYGRRGSAGSRCAFRPERAGRRKQEALPKADVVVQQINHRAPALDPLGDEVDAETTEQVG